MVYQRLNKYYFPNFMLNFLLRVRFNDDEILEN